MNVRTLAPLLYLASLLDAPVAGAQPATPDIVVIMADDLDVGSFETALQDGCTTDGRPCLPNLARYLVTAGTTFTESFASQPLCCPSRSTFLTGQYPHNHLVLRNGGPAGGFTQFYRQNAASSLPVWLAPRYRTAHVGKYLNGYVFPQLAPEGWEEWHGLVDPGTYCMYGFTISHNGRPQTYPATPENYQTDVLAHLADTFIREHDASGDPRPFFLSIAPLAPHLESQCNPSGVRPAPRHAGTVNLPLPSAGCSFNEPNMGDKPEWMRALPPLDAGSLRVLYNQRLASLRAVDDLVGTVITALRETGRLETTALLFTSDNGYLLGQHRWQSKVLVYEESIRVPLVVRLPGRASRATAEEIVLNNDLAPTILALAGASPDPGHILDGRSLLPLLDGSAPRWRRRFLVDFPPPPPGAEETSPNWDLMGEAGGSIPAYLAVRTGASGDLLAHTVYSETLDAAGAVTDRELYDLAVGADGFADPLQCSSLHAATGPLRVFQRQQLGQQLAALKSCGQGTCQVLEE
jgi:N-acetylglucosamine-6-sulfatase